MKTQPRSCPVCETVLDGATQVDGKEDIEPKDGDISICLYCGTCCEFQGEKLRAMTDEEVYGLSLDGRTRRMLIRARELWETDLKPRFGKANAKTGG